MADIYYDTTNNKVVGLNLKEKTSDIDMVRIADEILPNITKIVTKKGEYVHKRDSKGNLLYTRELVDPQTGKVIGTDIMDKSYMYSISERKRLNEGIVYIDSSMDTINDAVYEVTSKEKIEYDPYIAKEDRDEIVAIKDEPAQFTIEEVLHQKYLDMVNASNLTYIIAFHSATDSEDILVFDSEFMMVNAKGAILRPGEFISIHVPLSVPTNKFRLLELSNNKLQVYLSGNVMTDIVFEFTGKLDNVTIMVKNNTSEIQSLQSFALGHN